MKRPAHPAVLVTAQRVLDAHPSVVHVVPLTSTNRGFGSEILLEPDRANGLDTKSAAQCQQIRAASIGRVDGARGNDGGSSLSEIRDVIGLILDIAS